MRIGRFLIATCWAACLHTTEAQEVSAIWHCTKQSSRDQRTYEPIAADFSPNAHDTIQVTLDDLMAVYSGYPVRISGRPLYACFMPSNEALTLDALGSMNFNASALQVLGRRSAIVQRHLEIVSSEEHMLMCMERNAPAFGYFSQPMRTSKVAPCF